MADEMTTALPGLGPIPAPPNALAIAAEKLIQHLTDQALIEPQHVLTVQLVRDLAAVMGRAALKGQAAAMALASKELREAMALLPIPATADDSLAAFMAEFAEEASRG